MIGVVSDTHDNIDAVEGIVEAFEDRGVETVVHCGDFIAPPVVSYFDGFELHGVLGNNDGEIEGLKTAFESIDGGLHGRFTDLTFDGTRFAVLHGEDNDEVQQYAESGEYDYVLRGHYHIREKRDVDGTTVLNPGGHFPTVPEKHRTVAVVDGDEVSFVGVS